jgi:hypothetical protein
MIEPIPAPGFKPITGKRNPPDNGKGYWVQLRNGWVDELGPWPARGPRWKWGEQLCPFDVIAVKPA